ncbi:MAG: S8 family serine peptidase [Xanthobacteraceae bacterium]
MATNVLIEIPGATDSPFEAHAEAASSLDVAGAQLDTALSSLGLEGIRVDPLTAPVPMFLSHRPEDAAANRDVVGGLESFGVEANAAAPSNASIVVAAEVTDARLDELRSRKDVIVWANSELVLLGNGPAAAAGHVDCRPFRNGVTIDEIRRVLGVKAAWDEGFKGSGIVVGIIDEGVNGENYPVTGGFSRPASALQPGAAAIKSHGSMCAADILIAAPEAKIFDYPFLGVPRSGGALQMFQAVLDQRRKDGTPHITNNSYGFVGIPPKEEMPEHEIHDINHPVHRKILEVVAAGVACFFAAGNCGADCPSGKCHISGIGPGKSIHASNSLAEVITIAAVNSGDERIGYSSQGPGMFEQRKPDLACFSHMFGNFGPGRPGGTPPDFDNGTSAATPVAVGVAAMLLSAFNNVAPAQLKSSLIQTARKVGGATAWNADFGHGVIDADKAFQLLKEQVPAVG